MSKTSPRSANSPLRLTLGTRRYPNAESFSARSDKSRVSPFLIFIVCPDKYSGGGTGVSKAFSDVIIS